MTTTTSGEGDVRAKRGAMTMAMHAVQPEPTGRRALRVARVRDGRIEEERIERDRLRIGASEKAEMALPGVALMELFRRDERGWVLNLPAGAELTLAPAAPRSSGTIRLARDARGRLRVGGVTLLFQLVEPPPVVTKPQLPASVRGGLFGQVDWAFTTISAAVFTFFFAAMVFLEGADWPVVLDGLERSREVSLLFIEAVPPAAQRNWADDEPEPELDRDPEPETEPETETPRRTERRDGDAQPSRRDRPSRNDEAAPSLDADAMAQQAVNLMLGALSNEGGSALDDLINGADTSNAGEIIALFEGVTDRPTARNDRLHDRDTRGSGERETIGMLARRVPADSVMEGGGLREDAPRGTIRREDPIESGGTGVFDSRTIVQRIRGMSRRFQRCYEHDLTRDSTIAGRITFTLRISEVGQVRASVRDNDVSAEVGRCIARHLNTIRFRQGPEGGSIEYEFPFIFAPQR